MEVASRLLLVEDSRDAEPVALRVLAALPDRPALAVGRDDDATREADLAGLLARELKRAVVDPRVGPGVVGRIAHDRVVLAVELTGPLVVQRLAVSVDPVDR